MKILSLPSLHWVVSPNPILSFSPPVLWVSEKRLSSGSRLRSWSTQAWAMPLVDCVFAGQSVPMQSKQHYQSIGKHLVAIGPHAHCITNVLQTINCMWELVLFKVSPGGLHTCSLSHFWRKKPRQRHWSSTITYDRAIVAVGWRCRPWHPGYLHLPQTRCPIATRS
ncbi:hypothetical protein FB451DRAFT_1255429 [Mycena latifolia]|nr:hypothetical protein FB451DRAFT_1255429 [Mycena latifolia]